MKCLYHDRVVRGGHLRVRHTDTHMDKLGDRPGADIFPSGEWRAGSVGGLGINKRAERISCLTYARKFLESETYGRCSCGQTW